MGFIEDLGQLSATNFWGGLANAANATEKQMDNAKLVEYATLFNKRKAILEGTIDPTQQQIADINANLPQGTPAQTTQQKADDFRNQMYLSLDRMGAYANLYQPFITAFATLGGDGVRVANTLSNELKTKMELEEQKMNVPILETEQMLKNAQLASTLLNTDIAKFNFDKSKTQWQNDLTSQKLLADFFKDPDGQQLWSWLTGAQYQGSVLQDDPNFKPTMTRFFQKFQNNPAFGLAWSVFANNPKIQRKSILMPNAGGMNGNITGNKNADKLLLELRQLQDDSMRWDMIHSSNDFPYRDARKLLFPNNDNKLDAANAQTRVDQMSNDNMIKQVVQNYLKTFVVYGDGSYQSRYSQADQMIKLLSGGKDHLGFDWSYTLPNGSKIDAKDLVIFDKNTNQPIYEPYLYKTGYYSKNSYNPSKNTPGRTNMFAPAQTSQDITKYQLPSSFNKGAQ